MCVCVHVPVHLNVFMHTQCAAAALLSTVNLQGSYNKLAHKVNLVLSFFSLQAEALWWERVLKVNLSWLQRGQEHRYTTLSQNVLFLRLYYRREAARQFPDRTNKTSKDICLERSTKCWETAGKKHIREAQQPRHSGALFNQQKHLIHVCLGHNPVD